MPLSEIIIYLSLFVSLFFEVFILITYFEAKEELKFEETHLHHEPTSYPSVSIIVPSFNEEKTVAATVRSLLALDYPKDKLSLILIDDGSTDRTLEVLHSFKHNPQISVFTKPNEGSKFAALNFGLTKINSDLVGCLDADSFVDPNALKLMIPFFNDESIMAVTPSIKVHEPKTVLQYIQKVEYTWGVFFRRMLSSMGALYVTPGPFSIFRTRVFNELGGYKHAHHTEDMEIALRMQRNRYKIVTAVGAHVYTVTPDKLKDLYKQRVRWSYGFLNNAIDYRDMFFNPKYGNISTFILPIATFSVFGTLYGAGTFLWNIISKVGQAITKYKAVGFSFQPPQLSFDWFFVNTSIITCIALIALSINIGLLLMSTRMAKEKKMFSKELFYYLTMYVFLVPLWLTKAMYSTVFSRKVTWR